MLIRKWTKKFKLGTGEMVRVAVVSVGVRDSHGNKNRLVKNNKYIVSGDVPDGLFEDVPIKLVKEVKEDE